MTSLSDSDDERDLYLGEQPGLTTVILRLTTLGLPLRELIYEYKYQILVLFKCCLLQPKVTIIHKIHCKLLISVDAILWYSMRKIVHDAVFFNILNTRSSAQVGGLCRSRV